jgi:hypothetical protein
MEDLILILLRWLHFLFGIAWIGLLYYFNFVQTPFFAETEPPVRRGAQQKLLPRALWWFRWGAMGTVIFGLIYLIMWWNRIGFLVHAVDGGDFHRGHARPLHVGQRVVRHLAQAQNRNRQCDRHGRRAAHESRRRARRASRRARIAD